MPTHVYANNNEVASKAADGKSIAAFPDVCFSPPAPPVGPMPLPYPNTGEVKDTDQGTAKVFVKDKMSGMAGDSHMTKSMGDEPATQIFNKGMITSALQGKCYFGLWSMDVNMEGKGVPRHLDMVTHNHACPNCQTVGANQSNHAESNSKDLTASPEEKLNANFIIRPFEKDKNQKVIRREDGVLCGNCGSEVFLHGSGKINSEEKIKFIITNLSTGEQKTFESDMESSVLWEAKWIPDPGIKTDTEFTLEAQSTSHKSDVATKNYKVKQIQTNKFHYHQPQQQAGNLAKIMVSIKDNCITFSLNFKFDFYSTNFCSDGTYTKDNNFNEHIQKALYISECFNYDLGIKLDWLPIVGYLKEEAKRALSINDPFLQNSLTKLPPPPYAGWEPNSMCQYPWLTPEIEQDFLDYCEFWNGTNYPTLETNAVSLKKASDRISELLLNVENFYNKSSIIVRRKNCLHGDNCTCRYPVKFKFNVVTDEKRGNHIQVVNIHRINRTSQSKNWGLFLHKGRARPDAVIAHEIGHAFGFYDEYKQFTVDLGNQRANAKKWKLASGALMDTVETPRIRDEYLYTLLQALKDITGMDFQGEVAQKGWYNFKTKQFQ